MSSVRRISASSAEVADHLPDPVRAGVRHPGDLGHRHALRGQHAAWGSGGTVGTEKECLAQRRLIGVSVRVDKAGPQGRTGTLHPPATARAVATDRPDYAVPAVLAA